MQLALNETRPKMCVKVWSVALDQFWGETLERLGLLFERPFRVLTSLASIFWRYPLCVGGCDQGCLGAVSVTTGEVSLQFGTTYSCFIVYFLDSLTDWSLCLSHHHNISLTIEKLRSLENIVCIFYVTSAPAMAKYLMTIKATDPTMHLMLDRSDRTAVSRGLTEVPPALVSW